MERFQYKQFKEATARLPEKILKKRVDKAGISNYLVQWSNSNVPTWELADAVQDYLEVINDFNHFAITGERQPRGGNVMSRVIPSQQLPSYTKKKTSVIISDPLTFPKSQPTPQIVKKVKKIIPLCLVGSCQKKLLGQYRKYHRQEQDEISQVRLIKGDEENAFEVSYKHRPDGTIPYPSYYNSEQFILSQPEHYISFLEQCIFEVKHQEDKVDYIMVDYRELMK